MLVTVNIPDELIAQDAADGLSLKSYVEKLIAERTAHPEARTVRRKSLTREELNAGLDRLAQFSDKIPNPPIEAFSRAGFYEDHD
jgi:hypothetical protein